MWLETEWSGRSDAVARLEISQARAIVSAAKSKSASGVVAQGGAKGRGVHHAPPGLIRTPSVDRPLCEREPTKHHDVAPSGYGHQHEWRGKTKG